MGVVGEMEVLIRVHGDGCIIMTGDYMSPFINIDYYERYAAGTPVSRCLRALASWCEQVEGGERDSEALWVELQLPFDLPPSS